MPGWFYTTGWLMLLTLAVGLEGLALWDTDKGDTLTEHVRAILFFHNVIWFAAIGAAAWAVLHLFFKMR